MWLYVLQVILFLSLPALAIWLSKQHKFLQIIGPVVVCYFFGMLMVVVCDGLASLAVTSTDEWTAVGINAELPEAMPEAMSDSDAPQPATAAIPSPVPNWVMTASIPLAIPLLLFGLSIRLWLKQSPTMLLSFTLAVASVLVVAVGAHVAFVQLSEDSAAAVGMLTSMYTGGSMSMAAVHLALDTPEALFTALQGSDILIGGMYLLFLLSLARLVFGWVLPPYPEPTTLEKQLPNQVIKVKPLFAANRLLQMGFALLLSAAIVGVSIGASLLLENELNVPIIMLVITALAIAASMVSRIRAIPNTYAAGYYLMLMFCIALGSLVDMSQIVDNLDPFFVLVAVIMLGSIMLHLLLAKLFKIDRDTFIITSTAAIYGPPFIPSVASALRNPAMLLPGLVTGLVGYAIAHHLGYWMAQFLMWLPL